MQLRSMTTEDLLGLSVLCIVLIVSALFYRHAGRRYASGRASHASVTSFRLAYAYIRVTTILAGIGSYFITSPVLFDLHDNTVLERSGMLVTLTGLAVFVASKKSLGAAYSPCFDAHLPFSIVRSGPYRFVRHPIYTGNMTILTGLALMTGSLWIAANAVLLAVYATRSARLEERALAAAMPGYRSYMTATGCFVPRLRGRR